jgi:hypothetical protein
MAVPLRNGVRFFGKGLRERKGRERTTRGMADREKRHNPSWKKRNGRGGNARKDRRKKGVNREKRGCKA